MSHLITVKSVDREFYHGRVRDFLPPRIIDVHTHVWRAADRAPAPHGPGRTVTWPDRVAAENPIEDLLETYRLLLPGKTVLPLIFANVPNSPPPQRETELARMNSYVGQCAAAHHVPALCFTDPAWDTQRIEDELARGEFVGAKSYLSLAPSDISAGNIRITDFFPPHQLEVLNRRGAIVMLHLPRPGRLRDPVNLGDMFHIERTYPNLQLIIAHVGRAYCEHDVGDAFDALAGSERMLFDISANTNASVFEQLLRAVGPRRVLFGTDMPILRMRMRRVTEGDHYVNIVPRGLYGDVSDDQNMAEVDGAEAEALTFFLYEEIDAFRRAAESVGLSKSEIEDVFYNNAARVLGGAGYELPNS